MYQFVYNPNTAEFSDICPCGNGLELEIEKDGGYRIVTFRKEGTKLENGAINAGDRLYDAEYIMDHIEDAESALWHPEYIGEYEVDDIFSVCKLKKCLAELELKTFQDMLKNCGKIKCRENDDVKAQRDFLYIAIGLIEHYAELGKIKEAQDIYDSLQGCGDICKNLLKEKRSCGCNG